MARRSSLASPLAFWWATPPFSVSLPIFVFLCLLAAQAEAALPWRWSNPRPHGNHIYDSAYHNGVYIQVCDRGQIYTSEDLDTWTLWNSGTTKTLRNIAFLGNRTLISGAEGTIVWSDDLQNFQALTLPTSSWLEGIAASATMAVAVGDNGTIFSSADGLTWTKRTSPTTQWLTSVAYQNGFVAVGENATVLQSPDGITWQASGGTIPFAGKDIFKVKSINDQLWAVGEAGLVASLGVRGWGAVPSLGTNDLYSIAGATNEWIAVGDNAVFAKSGAGAWTSQTSVTTANYAPAWPYYSVLWDERLFFIGGKSGLTLEGYRTNASGGLQWFLTEDSPRNWLWSVTRQGELYAAVGNNGRIMTSANGIGWDVESAPITTNTFLLGIGGRPNLLVAVGSSGTILTSPDALEPLVSTNAQGQRVTNMVSVFGIRWTKQNLGTTTRDLQGVAANNATIVVTGAEGTILRSSNGANWTPSTSLVSTFLSSVAYANNRWVATGDRGTITTSSDATLWAPRSSGTTNWIYQVRALNGGFVLTSSDGLQWTARNLGPTRFTGWINDVAYVSGHYYAVSSKGAVLRSSDAVTWTDIGSNTSQSLYGLAVSSRGQLIAVGTDGAIIRAQAQPFTTPVEIADYDRISGNNAFLFSGEPDQTFKLQSSVDLQTWTDVISLEITDSEGTLVHLQPDTGTSRSFFRTISTRVE
jgi:hypothetical protein